MICGKEINLWAVERSDLVHNYNWGNDPELVKLTGMIPFPKSSWEIERWYESIQGNPNIHTFSIKLNDGTYIGNVEVSNIDLKNRKGEVGIMIGSPNSRGKGYGGEALQLMSRFAFEEMNLNKLYAKVLEFNHRAKKLFESCGYQMEGMERKSFYTWGKYWDVVLFGMLKDEFIEKYGRKIEK